MKNYRERPKHFRSDSTLFLIQNPMGLNPEVLDQILQSSKQGSIISFERLFRGRRQAIIVYGPSQALLPFKDALSLLELNDYTEKFTSKLEGVEVWEMVGKNLKDLNAVQTHLSVDGNLELSEGEQFWWQIVMQPQSHNYVIRAVLLLQNDKRAASLHAHLSSQLSNISIISLPRSHKKETMVSFYKERSLGPRDLSDLGMKLEPEEILYLLKIFN